ncbi:Ig-like V-type domain-containing protein FAM187A [Biomphalaria pfeifferi]|uniref:Ig-like V-type domain-containing protein FAM187A n=1 Tax=Biomphalaria pfeifferi TaxID=112525 RepID=A0AAD8FN98_BIOPF|nr:Ig-like V-type domain-containing protein FAM187A [Biomphalaria pfeifferi]
MWKRRRYQSSNKLTFLIFSCWCKNRKVASLKVIVVDEENKRLKLYISYGGLVTTTIGSFLIVFCICCKKSDKNAR